MPFVSQEQWRKFGELLNQGKISQSTFDEWAHSSPPFASLPKYHAQPKGKAPTVKRKRR